MSNRQIDPRWYTSPERAQQEWDGLWTRVWNMGPRVEELPEPGDGFHHSFGKESLLFIRSDSGEIHGLYNVCRHRGNRLYLGLDGPFHLSELNCAFHGWRYRRDGVLKSLPYQERFDDLRPGTDERLNLARFRVESWAGWLWFTLDEEAPPLSDYLGGLKQKLDAYRMERARIVDYKTFEFSCNWKTCLDAFNESYHFISLHPEILDWGNEDAPITFLGIHSMMVNEYGAPSKHAKDPDAFNPSLKAYMEMHGIDPARFEGTPADVRLEVQRLKRAQEKISLFPYASLEDGQLTDAYHYLFFPNLHFNMFPEFYVAMRYRPHPSGNPEKMYFDFIMCAPIGEDEVLPDYEHRVIVAGSEPVEQALQWGKRGFAAAFEVLSQDVSLIEHVQKGMRSDSFKGPILGSDEIRLPHFHFNIDRLVTGDATIADLIREQTS